MSKTAFLFPGQGVQKCGMGKDFYENSSQAAKLFEKASEALGLDMKALCFEENARLDQTEYTQAALVTTYLAMCRELESRGVKPDITAGLSLGEYAAIAVAGAMSDLDAIRLVRKRGMLMQNTVPAGEGAMCAILALDEKKIEEVLNEVPDVTIANYNCLADRDHRKNSCSREGSCPVKRGRSQTDTDAECQWAFSFPDAGTGRSCIETGTGAGNISETADSVCDKCECL